MIALLIVAASLASSPERPAALDPTGPGGRISAAALKDRARELSGLADLEAAASYIESSFRSAGVAPAAEVAPFLEGYRHRHDVVWAEVDPSAGPARVVVQRSGASASFDAIAIRSAPSAALVEPTDEVFLVDPEDLEWLGALESPGTSPSLPGGVVVTIRRSHEPFEAASGLEDQVRGALRLGAAALILVESSPTAYAAPAPGPPPDLLMLRAGPELALDLVGRQGLARLAAPRLTLAEPGFRPILLDLRLGASGPYRRGLRTAISLIGYLKGADPILSREAVLIVSGYGAANSAADAAALIEVARMFAEPAHRPARSLLLAALDGEPIDRAGSHALAARMNQVGVTLVAVVEIGPLSGDSDPFRQAGMPTFSFSPEGAEMAVRTVWELAR